MQISKSFLLPVARPPSLLGPAFWLPSKLKSPFSSSYMKSWALLCSQPVEVSVEGGGWWDLPTGSIEKLDPGHEHRKEERKLSCPTALQLLVLEWYSTQTRDAAAICAQIPSFSDTGRIWFDCFVCLFTELFWSDRHYTGSFIWTIL